MHFWWTMKLDWGWTWVFYTEDSSPGTLRTYGLTGLTVLEIFASVLANPFFGPDGQGLIISTAVKYARLFIFHSILGNKISDVYREICSCLYKIVL